MLGYFMLEKNSYNSWITCVSLYRGVEHEQSPKLMSVQNQILHFKGPSYGCYLYVSVSIPQAYQENPFGGVW